MHEAAREFCQTLTELGERCKGFTLISDLTTQVTADKVLEEVVLLPLIHAFIEGGLHACDIIFG